MLREYLEHLEAGQWYRTEEYLIARLPQDRLLIPDGWERCELSPDNMGNVTHPDCTLLYQNAGWLNNPLTETMGFCIIMDGGEGI